MRKSKLEIDLQDLSNLNKSLSSKVKNIIKKDLKELDYLNKSMNNKRMLLKLKKKKLIILKSQ